MGETKKPFERPDWNEIPDHEADFIGCAFALARADIEAKSGFRYGLRPEGGNFLIGPDGTSQFDFRIVKADDDYLIGESQMTMNSRPLYVGPLDDRFADRLKDILIDGLPSLPRLAYRDAVPGMPRNAEASIEQLEDWYQGPAHRPKSDFAHMGSPPAAPPARDAGEPVTLMRKPKGSLRLDWS